MNASLYDALSLTGSGFWFSMIDAAPEVFITCDFLVNFSLKLAMFDVLHTLSLNRYFLESSRTTCSQYCQDTPEVR